MSEIKIKERIVQILNTEDHRDKWELQEFHKVVLSRWATFDKADREQIPPPNEITVAGIIYEMFRFLEGVSLPSIGTGFYYNNSIN